MKDGVVVLNFAVIFCNGDDMKEALESGKVAKYVTDFPNPAVVKMPNVTQLHILVLLPRSPRITVRSWQWEEIRDFMENGNIPQFRKLSGM